MANLLDLLHGLTKVEVAGPDGNVALYNPPETGAPGKNALAFLQGVSKQNAQAIQPETDIHSGVQLPDASGDGGSGVITQQDNAHPLAFLHPSVAQASTDAAGLPHSGPALTTKGKLLMGFLRTGLGALEGSGQRTAAEGFKVAVEQPIQMAGARQQLQRGNLENQVLQQQAADNPLYRMLGIQKAQADINHTVAQTNSLNDPIADALKKAQTEAAYYKDDPNLGLIDVRTKQPVSNAGAVPLSQEEADVLGKQLGERVPLKLKNTANEIMNRGVRSVQAGGRSLLVDNKGKTIKDLGASNPVVVNQLNQGGLGNPNDPMTQAVIDAVGTGRVKLSDVLPYRVPGEARKAFIAAVAEKYPKWNGYDYAVQQGVAKDFTSGADSQQLNSINRAREHMKVFLQTAKDLDNGNVQAFNRIAQAFGTQFGGDKATNLAIAKQAFSSEVGKAFAGANVAEGDRREIGDQVSRASSFSQLAGVAKTADSLLAGAQKVLKQKYDLGKQGKPNFGAGSVPSGAPAANPHADIGFVPANQ